MKIKIANSIQNDPNEKDEPGALLSINFLVNKFVTALKPSTKYDEGNAESSQICWLEFFICQFVL